MIIPGTYIKASRCFSPSVLRVLPEPPEPGGHSVRGRVLWDARTSLGVLDDHAVVTKLHVCQVLTVLTFALLHELSDFLREMLARHSEMVVVVARTNKSLEMVTSLFHASRLGAYPRT